jgi:tRNA(Ile)-lysidine synthase
VQPDIPSTILTLPNDKLHMANSNIETTVRTLRYQALGESCRKKNINKLLLGHHEDDQYESILQRLSASHSRGLKAMRSLANLPECFGMYGLHGSGNPQHTPSPRGAPTGVYQIEGGSIAMGRPLLHFPKERLIATCKKFNVPWIEDQSNKDVQLTSRNAIRHIIRNHTLPAGLGKDSLLRLSSSKRQKSEQMETGAEELFNQHRLALDVRTGVLTISHAQGAFPPSISQTHFIDQKEQMNNVKIGLFYRMASLVSPNPSLQISSFNAAATASLNFTAGNVHFVKTEDPNAEWVLSRVPYNVRDKTNPSIYMLFPTSQETLPSKETFKLWDGRFWIRVHNPSGKTFLVRPLCEGDVASIRSLLKSREIMLYSVKTPPPDTANFMEHEYAWKRLVPPDFDKILEKVAKGQIRYTLPVIAEVDETTGQSNLCALPTLGLRFGLGKAWREGFQNLRWEVRYKEVNLGKVHLEDSIVDCGSRVVFKHFRKPRSPPRRE